MHAGAEKGSCGEDRGKGQDRNFVIDQNLQPKKLGFLLQLILMIFYPPQQCLPGFLSETIAKPGRR